MTRAHQSTMKITLRDYAPADFEMLYEIDQQTFEPGIAYSRPQLRGYLKLEGGQCILAESDGKIAGFLVTAHEGGIGYVVTIDVLPAYRRHSHAQHMQGDRRAINAQEDMAENKMDGT